MTLDGAPLKVIGIDPGTRVMGYGIVSRERAGGGRVRLIQGGVVRIKEALSLPERLRFVASAINDLMDSHRPHEMAIESIFIGENPRSAIMLAHARAVAMLSAALRDIPVYEYTARAIKLSVTGSGNATKEQVQKMARLLLKAHYEPCQDEADAISAAICHLSQSPVQRLKTLGANSVRTGNICPRRGQ
jgi:crossover junction endodeoxyribonuclease RuvC